MPPGEGGSRAERTADAKKLRDSARLAFVEHDFTTAEEDYSEALRVLGDGMSFLTALLYQDLAMVWSQTGRFAAANDLHRASETMLGVLGEHLQPTVEQLRERVESLRSDPADRAELGQMLFELAQKERAQRNDVEAAHRHLTEAVAIGRDIAPDETDTVKWRAALVVTRLLTGDREGALALGDEIRDALRVHDAALASELLRTLAQIRWQAGNLDRAAVDAAEAIAAADESRSDHHRAAARSAAGLIDHSRGDLDAAVTAYRGAFEMFQASSGDSVPAAVTLTRLGEVSRDREDLVAAGDYFSRAVQMLKQVDRHCAELPAALTLLADHRKQTGDWSGAVAAYRAAEAALPPGIDRVRRQLDRGLVEKDMRELDAAEQTLTHARTDAEQLGDTDLVWTVLMALAGVQRWQGNLDAAEVSYRELLSRAATGGDRANALSNLGGVLHERGEHLIAAEHYREALAGMSGAPTTAIATITFNLATALHFSGQLTEAEQRYLEAQRGMRGLSQGDVAVRTARARIANSQQRYDDAIVLFAEAIELIEQLRCRGGPALLADLLVHYAELQVLLAARARPGDAAWGLQLAEMTRARSLDEGLQTTAGALGLGDGARELREKLAVVARRRMHAVADKTTPQYLLADLMRQERELTAAWSDLKSDGDLRPASPVLTAAQIAAALPDGALLLEFAVVFSQVFVWAVTADHLELRFVPTEVEALTALVQRAVDPFRTMQKTPTDTEAWDTLRDILIAPLRDLLETASTVLISPAGPLHHLSFEPLIDGPTIVYVPSATVGLRSADHPAESRRFDAEFVGFGNPAFNRDLVEFTRYRPLPGAELEVSEIARLFGSRGVAFCGEAANEPNVRSWVRRTRYLHFATHGFPDLHNPLRSGLILASPAAMPVAANYHDDVLHAYEMVDMRISAELVVCASCYSGYGDIRAGEGMASIGGALLQAGARWVLVTLWPVGDVITADFTRTLYRALLAGATVPAAVDAARREIREYHQDPRWWAPFVLFGVQR